VDAIADKKGEDILLLDIREQSQFTDYFVLGSGTSERHLRALMEGLEAEAKTKHVRRPLSVEGGAETGWVLVDYGDVIVHLFAPEKREYYNLEGLWREGKVVVRMQ
jgi:ribosome-associated protein